jgi:hypothetical protein
MVWASLWINLLHTAQCNVMLVANAMCCVRPQVSLASDNNQYIQQYSKHGYINNNLKIVARRTALKNMLT